MLTDQTRQVALLAARVVYDTAPDDDVKALAVSAVAPHAGPDCVVRFHYVCDAWERLHAFEVGTTEPYEHGFHNNSDGYAACQSTLEADLDDAIRDLLAGA